MRFRNTNNSISSFQPPAWLIIACVIGIVIGIIGLAVCFALSPLDGWLWLLFNFVVFCGFANAILIWAAIFRTAQARWSPAINRIGHATLMYVPVLFIVLVALMAGAGAYMPWVLHPVSAKEVWLNVPALAIRDIASSIALWVLCLFLVRWSLVADSKTRAGDEITEREHYRLNSISVGAIAVYSITSSIISWDMIMSLSPKWYSTMLAPYFFSTNIYAAMGILVIMSFALRKRLHVEEHIMPDQFNKMGNLMLAFVLFDMGLFYAQYATIWYENLPEETFFLIIRYLKGSWPYIGWASFICGYGIPFVLLQSRGIKHSGKWLSAVSALAILGVSLERYILIVPSIHPHKLMLFPIGVLSVLAFLGTFILAIILFLTRYSPVSTAEEALLHMEVEEMKV